MTTKTLKQLKEFLSLKEEIYNQQMAERKAEANEKIRGIMLLGLQNYWSNGYVHQFEHNDYKITICDQKIRQIVEIAKKIPEQFLQNHDVRYVLENIHDDSGYNSDLPKEIIDKLREEFTNEITGTYIVESSSTEYAVENAINKINNYV